MRDISTRLMLRPLSRSQVLEVMSRSAAERARQRRLTAGVYRFSGSDLVYEQRLHAYREILPSETVFAGASAAWIWGVRETPPVALVEAYVPTGRRVRRRAGLTIRTGALAEDEVVETPWGLVTSPSRTAVDLADRGDLPDAVARVDEVLRLTRTPVETLSPVIARGVGRRGIRQVRQAISLADPRAGSRPESRWRVLLVTAGFPRPVPQVEVHDAGLFVARLALAWPECRIGIELDGGDHHDPARFGRDLRRHNRLRAAEWVVLRADPAPWREPEEFLSSLRGMLRRCDVEVPRIGA
jgi:hypothetical protein